MPITQRRYTSWPYFTGLFLLALLLSACGGGSTSSTSSNSGSTTATGNVAVLLTDAPSDEFSEINLTITRIELLAEDGSRTVLFTGDRTINLLDLRNNSDLFSLADVPSGDYEKIRMTVTAVELVKKDELGNVIEIITPKLPGNGKIDLNPRTTFHVTAGETVVLEIDVDAKKSIHIVGQGNGGYIFRPVVFVNILSNTVDGKFIKVRGEVSRIDLEKQSFRLCGPGLYADRHENGNEAPMKETMVPMAMESTTSESPDQAGDQDQDQNQDQETGDSNGDHDQQDDDMDTCVTIRVGEGTLFFSTIDGSMDFGQLQEGDMATVLGRIDPAANDEHMTLNAKIVLVGNAQDRAWASGTVSGAYDSDTNSFELLVESGYDPVPGEALTIQLDDDTRVFNRNGDELSPTEIMPGMAVQVIGRQEETTSGPVLHAFVIFLHDPALDSMKMSGTISDLEPLSGSFMLLTSEGDRCVRIGSAADIFQITVADGGFSSEQITRFSLADGQQVDVYGQLATDGCLEAENILATAN